MLQKQTKPTNQPIGQWRNQREFTKYLKTDENESTPKSIGYSKQKQFQEGSL